MSRTVKRAFTIASDGSKRLAIFRAPTETKTAVNHRLHRGRRAHELDGGGQDYPVRLFKLTIDHLHVIIYATATRLGAGITVLTGGNLEIVKDDGFDISTPAGSTLHNLIKQKVGITTPPRTTIDTKNLQLLDTSTNK